MRHSMLRKTTVADAVGVKPGELPMIEQQVEFNGGDLTLAPRVRRLTSARARTRSSGSAKTPKTTISSRLRRMEW